MTDVVFVDDDDDLREATSGSLSLAGFAVVAVGSGEAALRAVDEHFDGVVVTDIRMPGMHGLQLLDKLLTRDPDLPVILVSGHADVPTTVDALKRGAYDVLEKPFAVDQLIASVRRALERRRLVLENRRLRHAAPDLETSPLLGSSPAIEHLRRTVAQIAAVDIDVLIEGETGTGKGVVAQMLHALSRRRGPIVTVDCGALPEALVESELFGHVSGAFPGAQMPRTGRIEQANRGTLFLDEIDAMSDQVQARVQRVVEHREVVPLGASASRRVDIRIVSASTVGSAALAQTGRLRRSLFYRLNGVTLLLPPLRERREDILPLFRTFTMRAATRLGTPSPTLDARTFQHLEKHDWPGNVRELMRFAEAFALGLTSDAARPGGGEAGDLRTRVDRFEAEAIEAALVEANGDATRAMAALNLARKTFYYKVQRLGIDLARFRR